jgi:tetratricopeptide (TPR) repeat protein
MKSDLNLRTDLDTKTALAPDNYPANFNLAANLRQALEHVNDPDWLKANSALDSSALLDTRAAPAQAAPRPAPPGTGIRSQDDLLQVIWQDWESRSLSPLQSLLWSAALQVAPARDANHAALLLLTYFQYPRPRQADLIKQLAVGQSTYYRQLNAAIQSLERVVVTRLSPSLSLEWPAVTPLIGRAEMMADLLAALRAGSFVNLVGGSGLGKTALAAAIAHAWVASSDSAPSSPGTTHPASSGGHHTPLVIRPPSVAPSTGLASGQVAGLPSFWYTFRHGLTDNLQQLVFAMALFLQQQGSPNLWLHLTTKPEDLGPVKVMAMLRKSLEDLPPDRLPLFCFDEVDLLLPNDLVDDEQHAQLRTWLEEFVRHTRGHAPVLFAGQRLVLQPEHGRVFTLGRFGLREVRAMLQQSGIAADDAACEAVLSYTRGNPLLVQLLATLHRVGEPVLASPPRLASAISLDWFLARLRLRLSASELDLLDALGVFDAPAPADIWRKQARTLNRLAQLHLVEHDSAGRLSILPAVRDALYRQLPADLRAGLHVSAAQACAERGAYTLAAHHFALGGRPDMAVWTWYSHREQEVRQGQTQTALRILEPLRFTPLPDEKDRRALSLALADLYHLLGQHEDGLAALEAEHWHPQRASTTRARELRAKLLAMRGDVDAALSEYRASLDSLDALSAAKPIMLRVELAQQTYWRARDTAAARHEALLAQQDVEILLGDIEADAGHSDAALAHYHVAMQLARQTGDPVRLAKVNEALGILEARRLDVEAARRHLEEASRYYNAYGNLICAVGVTQTNMAYAYLLARRYREAIAPAEAAVAFFRDVNQPYWLSLNEANLAEAHANLGDARQAEEWAWRALSREEAAVRPYGLYVLGHARRLQRRYEEAERFCQDALGSANANGDLWAAGPAWRVLGEVYRDWGRPGDARAAFDEALRLYAQLDSPQEVAWLNDQVRQLA